MSAPSLKTIGTGRYCIHYQCAQDTILTLSLTSPTLPEPIVFTLSETAAIAKLKNNPVTIKEGVEYSLVAHLN